VVWDAIAFRVGRWLFFAVLLGLLPIGLGALRVATREAETFSIEALLGAGELLLVTAAILGAAVSDLVADHDRRFRTLRLYCGGSAGIVILASATWFADVTAAVQDDSALDLHAITSGSLWLFGAALVAGLSCLVMVEASRERSPEPAEEDA
jgi:hypothetical protein